MAAVLCNACGDICSGACEVCGHVCSAPCTLCSKMCDGCCNSCDACCRKFGELCTSPFSMYVTVATVFNAPSLVFGVMELMTSSLECRGSWWLFVNALLCGINIAAAFYMAIVVTKQQEPLEGNNNGKSSSAFARAGHLFCYDPWMAVYILVLCGFFIWLWTGAIWSMNGKSSNNCGSDDTQGKLYMALGFGWAFVFFGIGALMIGVCCAYCFDGARTAQSSATMSTTNYGSNNIASDYVHIDESKNKKNPPVAAAQASPVGGGSTWTKQEVPTVKATVC